MSFWLRKFIRPRGSYSGTSSIVYWYKVDACQEQSASHSVIKSLSDEGSHPSQGPRTSCMKHHLEVDWSLDLLWYFVCVEMHDQSEILQLNISYRSFDGACIKYRVCRRPSSFQYSAIHLVSMTESILCTCIWKSINSEFDMWMDLTIFLVYMIQLFSPLQFKMAAFSAKRLPEQLPHPETRLKLLYVH